MTQQNQQSSFNFLTPELIHRVELILHLLEHSNHLIIVKGVHESGKSTLFEELSRQQNINLLIKKLLVNPETTKNDIYRALISDVKDESQSHLYSQAELNKLLERCEKNQQVPVLLIDDVDIFNDELIKDLFEILTESNSVAALHFCLFCDPLFPEHLKQLGIDDDSLDMHIIDMPSLSEKQTEQYIHSRYPEDGASELNLFDEKTIQQIHRISHGMPGRINALCEQYLNDPAKNYAAKEAQPLLKVTAQFLKNKLIVVTGVCLLLLLVGVTLLSLQPSEQVVKKQAIKLNLPEINKGQDEQMNVVKAHANPALIEQPSSSAVPELDTGKNNTIIATVDNERTKSVTEVPDIKIAKTTEDSNKFVPDSDIVKEAKNIEIAAVESDSPTHDIEWLIKQDPDKYVLQLIGAYEKDTIKLYLKSFDSDEDQIIAFTTSNKGKDWHVLVYGIYDNRDKAVAAIETLPNRAKLMAPWPRTVGSIKDLLK